MSDNIELLTRIAHLYYKEDLTQEQIGKKEGLSRSKITRLLQEARRTGIVRIEITKALPPEQEEALKIQKAFKVKQAVVVRNEATWAATLNSLRRTLARLIQENLKEKKSIGFSFSQTIGNITEYFLPESNRFDGAICDLMGAMMGFPMPYSASTEVSRVIGGTLYPISAPIMGLNVKDRSTYLADPNNRNSMEIAKKVEFAVVGVGDFTTQNILYRSGYINEKTINNLRKQGIVGEICMRFFNIEGKPIQSEFDSRVISVPWKTLVNAKNVMVVSAGKHKVNPTLGALRTGIIHTLVTDYETARQILKRQEKTK